MRLDLQPVRLLRPLYDDLVRWDDSFTRAWGTSPSQAYVEAFDGVRSRLQRAATELSTSPYDELRPLGSTLDRRAGDLTRIRTQLWGMSAKGTTFGSGWDRVLDQAISDVHSGLQLIGADPGDGPFPSPWPGGDDEYPVP